MMCHISVVDTFNVEQKMLNVWLMFIFIILLFMLVVVDLM